MTLPDPAHDDEVPAAEESTTGPEPDAHAGLLQAVRSFVHQVMQDVKESLLSSLATFAAMALIAVVVVAAGAAMAATGAVLLVRGTAAAVAGWLGSVAGGDCVAGIVFLVAPVACALLAVRAWRR